MLSWQTNKRDLSGPRRLPKRKSSGGQLGDKLCLVIKWLRGKSGKYYSDCQASCHEGFPLFSIRSFCRIILDWKACAATCAPNCTETFGCDERPNGAALVAC